MAVKVRQKSEGAGAFTPIKMRQVSKQEQDIIHSSAMELEDEFTSFYDDGRGPTLLIPTYPPKNLKQLSLENNTLMQLVAAMEVNIDGTGQTIEPKVGVEESKETVKGILEFFEEVYPGKSFTTVRRSLRNDIESTGNGYLEVIRAMDDSIAFMRDVPATTVRLVVLDDAVPVEKTVTRFGQEQEVVMMIRERRFAQIVGQNILYFKEYGSKRDLDKWTGEWAEEGKRLPAADRATEILHFIAVEDAQGPYGIPRWTNNVKSALGSIKAEAFNLDFFNAGGLPPAMIFLAGGSLSPEVRRQVQSYLTGRGASKNRGGVVEVQPISASLDGGASRVKVQVERFGAEQQKDSMFENYDMKCSKRVSSAFRLPPIFIGKSEDYSFASAFSSYTVAEAQVFSPERFEFDEIINNTIMKELAPDYKIRSLPLNVNDVSQRLAGIEMLANQGAITNEALVNTVNEIIDLGITEEEIIVEVPNTGPAVDTVPQSDIPKSQLQSPSKAPDAPTAEDVPSSMDDIRKSDTMSLMQLATEYALAAKSGGDPILKQQVENLGSRDREVVNGYIALKMFGSHIDHDVTGCVELAGAAHDIMNCGCESHGS